MITIDCLKHKLSVIVDNEDTMENQRHCIKNSQPELYSNRIQDCVCNSAHSTVMSTHGGHFGCFSPKDVGCDYSLEGSDQAYMVDMSGHDEKKLTITPTLSETA